MTLVGIDDKRDIGQPLDGAHDAGPGAEQNVDWARLEAAASPADRVPIDRHVADVQEMQPSERLMSNAPIDPTRLREEVARLHPDRLVAARPDQQALLEARYSAEPTADTLAREINPGYWSDDPSDRAGRLTNCCDCARAFQDGLDGRPRVAAALDSRGLPVAEKDRALGEAQVYTEHWAGARAEVTSYDDVARQVRETRGSAILFGQGPDGGHAFNAYWDNERGVVRWADAQAGLTGDWPPDDHAVQFPKVEAIRFDRTRRFS